MAERLSTEWRLELQVLTPLHVGAGGPPLQHDYDFLVRRRIMWVIDVERALERLPDEYLEKLVDVRLSALLQPDDYAECARYSLAVRGTETLNEAVACVRGIDERPYLPGSSIKGALRTALAWSLLRDRDLSTGVRQLDGRRQYAAGPLEREIFGANPNQDLLRALRVSDAPVTGEAEAELAVAAVYGPRQGKLVSKGPGYRWHLEALPEGTQLAGSVSLDEYLFGARTRSLSFNQRRSVLAGLPGRSAAFARALALEEARYYAEAGLPAVGDFYSRLAEEAGRAEPGEGFMQLGWGTGWTSKTVGLLLRRLPEFPELLRRYRLSSGQGTGRFPRTRRLVERAGAPELPLGWVRFRLVEQREG